MFVADVYFSSMTKLQQIQKHLSCW